MANKGNKKTKAKAHVTYTHVSTDPDAQADQLPSATAEETAQSPRVNTQSEVKQRNYVPMTMSNHTQVYEGDSSSVSDHSYATTPMEEDFIDDDPIDLVVSSTNNANPSDDKVSYANNDTAKATTSMPDNNVSSANDTHDKAADAADDEVYYPPGTNKALFDNLPQSICTPNPTKEQRRLGLLNTFISREEAREIESDWEAMENMDSDDSTAGIRLHNVNGEYFHYEGKKTPMITRSLETNAPALVTTGRVYDDDGNIAGKAIPLMSNTTSYEESNAIADFLSGRLRTQAIAAAPAPPANASTSTSFFLHGLNSFVGDVTQDDSPDCQEWHLPDSAYKTKFMIHRLKTLDDAPRWQMKFQHTMNSILAMLKSLGSKNPYLTFSEDEQRIALLSVFEISVLFKLPAIMEMSMRYFSGHDCRRVDPKEVHARLREHIESLEQRSNIDTLLKKLKALRMSNTTYNGALAGHTCSRNLQALFSKFASVLTAHATLVQQYCNDNSILVHTFMTLIEPPNLRKYLIKYLAQSVQQHIVVTLYGCPPQYVTVNNIWAVYQLLSDKVTTLIDPTILTTTTFLENLVVNDFCAPHVPKEFLDMMTSPHEERKRKYPEASTGSHKPRSSGATERLPAGWNDSDRHPKRSATDKRNSKDAPLTGANKQPLHSKAPDTDAKDKTDRPRSDSRQRGSNRNDTDRAQRNDTKTQSKSDRQSTNPNFKRACCLCNEDGHQARRCRNYSTCTCGSALDSKHDPFTCERGPLTDAGKRQLATMQRVTR